MSRPVYVAVRDTAGRVHGFHMEIPKAGMLYEEVFELAAKEVIGAKTVLVEVPK